MGAELVDDLDDHVDRVRRGRAAALAIDMPIGLLDHQPRRCDVEARARLGPRRSSVFPSPVRATLGVESYADACEVSRRASGKALSKQAFHLIPQISAIDQLIVPSDQGQIVEAHPELAFARLAGQPLEESKHTIGGHRRRIELLCAADDYFAAALVGLIDNTRLPAIDLLDAAANSVTARHVAGGTEYRLGSDVDAKGLSARIVF